VIRRNTGDCFLPKTTPTAPPARLLHVLPEEVEAFAAAAKRLDADSKLDVAALKRRLRRSLKNPVLIWLRELPIRKPPPAKKPALRGESVVATQDFDATVLGVRGVLAYEIKPQAGKTKQPRKLVATTLAAVDDAAARSLVTYAAKTALEGDYRFAAHVSLASVDVLAWLRDIGCVLSSTTHHEDSNIVVLELSVAKAAKAELDMTKAKVERYL
jgi:hypothetical protein